ncbi:MAG TPA: cation:proton antiporter [Bacteroidaceae bacterium]|nr:cation:proton antiporter [Bacteroidaceae bacterium]
MINIYFIAAFWFLAALLSTIIANRLKISMALMEIIIGAVIGFIAFKTGFSDKLALDTDWMKFIAGMAAIMLTFLSGAELNPDSLKSKFKEITIVGLVGFFAPFVGAFLIANFLLHWELRPSLLAGIALSTTSMAVVYAVMIEYGFNKTSLGKSILGACFVNDLGTVIGLGLIFAPFNYKTLVFIAVTVLMILFLPSLTNFLIRHFAYKTAAIRTKWIIFILLSMGVLAMWSGSEPVLPAYIIGMVLARTIEKDNFFVRRLRTMTIGFLTPIYFLRAGALVSLPAIIGAFALFVVLFSTKILFKIFGLYPVISTFKKHKKEKWYYTLLMSTGLTFGTISALYGLTNNIISTEQYSIIVGVVIASAVVPTLIANRFFLPDHLLERPVLDDQLPDTINVKKRKKDF